MLPDDGPVSVVIEIEDDGRPFALTGFEPVTRGAWRRGREVVCANVCSSGFDLRVQLDGDRPRFTFRRRPPIAVKAAALLAPRARQLTLLTLLAYPVMWLAARNGRAPIHVSAFETSGHTMLVAGPAGVGKSTVLQQEVAGGGRPISDNLCVTDGVRVWPVSEPMRIEGAGGKRAPHGRAEKPVLERLAKPCREFSSCSAAARRRFVVSTPRPQPGPLWQARIWRESCAGSGHSRRLSGRRPTWGLRTHQCSPSPKRFPRLCRV